MPRIIELLLMLVTVTILTVLRVRRRRSPPPSRRSARADRGGRRGDLDKVLAELEQPTVLLRRCTARAHSYLGGAPPNHPGLEWPERDGRPLAFVACLDLADLQALGWLPPTGLVLFFYDLEEQVWGFDPKDRTGFAVRFVANPVVTNGDAVPPRALPAEQKLPRINLAPTVVSMPPSSDDARVRALELDDAGAEMLDDRRAASYGDFPRHQAGGHPDPVQNADMDLECQLVTNGLYCGNASGYDDPRASALRPGAADWSLLLQLDSDDALDVMWGDSGMLYFWIRRADAQAGLFEHAWVIQQCC